MKLLRLLLVTLAASAGLVVFTQVPAAACSCVGGDTSEHVEWADIVFRGTLVDIEKTNPGDDDVVSSGDPVYYSFDVEETYKGDARDGVVESVRFGASCGLEGMRVDQSYVVFASENKQGNIEANLCGGTAVASDRLVGQVEAAVASPPVPTATDRPEPTDSPVPTSVPSGVEPAAEARSGIPAWAWFGGGVVLALAGGAFGLWWPGAGSNRRPSDFQSDARTN